MMLYLAKFIENGGNRCGYLLKPHWMLSDVTIPKYPASFTKPLFKFTLTLYGGQYLYTKNDKAALEMTQIKPFVEVYVRGLETDEQNNKV